MAFPETETEDFILSEIHLVKNKEGFSHNLKGSKDDLLELVIHFAQEISGLKLSKEDIMKFGNTYLRERGEAPGNDRIDPSNF